MNMPFDPDWFTKALAMPFEKWILFPIGTILTLWLCTMLVRSKKMELAAEDNHQIEFSGFAFGIMIGSMLIIFSSVLLEIVFDIEILPWLDIPFVNFA